MRNMRAESAGVMVKLTSSDTAMANAMVRPKLFKNMPTMPLRKATGTNTASNESVVARTARPISRGPSTAELAEQEIGKLITQKKLAASWAKAKMTKFDYRAKNGGQYVLIYENATIKQAAKRRLFVVMTTNGKFVSAGHKLV